MANKKPEKKKVPPVAGYDRGPKDFFRGSRGFNNSNFGPSAPVKKDFLGFRRGSK